MSRPLILLLGQENSSNGELSAVALSRCDTAFKLSQKHTNAVILCTGSYGAHFNTTNFPHYYYLQKYLISKGIEQERFISGTNSSNTLEDCLLARKEIVNGEYSHIIVVTSEYHCSRVEFILRQVFRGITFTVTPATTPDEFIKPEQQKERRSFAWLKKNWITPPLYETNSIFPDSVYAASDHDQKHYDTVSLTAVTSAILIAGLLLNPTAEIVLPFQNIFKYILGFVINLVLVIVYERCAAAARVARRSMRLMEISFDCRGFSSNYDPHLLFRSLPSIQTAIRFLFGILLLTYAALIALSLCCIKM